LTLTANIFGAVSGVFGALPPPLASPIFGTTGLNATAVTTSAAFQAATAAQNVAFSTATATTPITFFFSTPIVAGAPLACSGAITLGCL
jgi:hypothetical protein